MNVNYTSEAQYFGHKAGLEEGIKTGIQTGVYEVAKNMLLEGLSYKIIAKVTKLSVAEIKALKP